MVSCLLKYGESSETVKKCDVYNVIGASILYGCYFLQFLYNVIEYERVTLVTPLRMVVFNPFTAKLFDLNFHPLEVVSR